MEQETPFSQSAEFNVLSLDGGGMRGLYSLNVLLYLEDRFRHNRSATNAEATAVPGSLDIGSGFDLIGGTSTGGIAATALALGMPCQKICELYKSAGPKIFRKPIPDLRWNLKSLVWLYGAVSKPAHCNEELERILREWFGNQTFGSLYTQRKIGLCIPAVKIHDNLPRVFKTGHISLKNRDDGVLLVDACLATSAAPIYLPPYFSHNGDNSAPIEAYADGGLWANNPVLLALTEALQMAGPDQDINIVSVGTCPAPSGAVLRKDRLRGGLKFWKVGIEILNLSMNAQSSGAQFTADFLAKSISCSRRKVRLIRIPQLPPSADEIKLLRLDLASEEALALFAQRGKLDGEVAFKWVQDPVDENGKALMRIFNRMIPAEG